MNEPLIAALDDCLTALEQGTDLEACLRRYPDLEARLRPELQAVLEAQAHVATIQPSPEFLEASRVRFLAQADALAAAKSTPAAPLASNNGHPTARPLETPMPSAWTVFWAWLTVPLTQRAVSALALLLVVILAGAGVLSVSAQSLPGDPLYGLKRAVEDTRLSLAPNVETRAQLEEEFDRQRRQEVQSVTHSRRSVSLEFGGMLETIGGECWSVNSISVIVPAGIEIKGSPQIGLYIHVRGSAQPDGSVLAQEIRVEGEIFQGRLEQIRAVSWQIGGRPVFVNANTRIKDNPQPGDEVEVKVMLLSDGSLLALEIRLVNRSGSREDHAGSSGKSGSDDRSSTPEPTHLPGSDDRGRSTETTPSAGSDDYGGRTPDPAAAPSVDDQGGSSSSTPAVEDNSAKGKSGSSTQAPQITKTDEPTKTPQPNRTPQPTKTPDSSSGGSSGGSGHASETPSPSGK